MSGYAQREMPAAATRYLARETAVGGLVNGLLSAGVFWIVFGGTRPLLPVWGIGGLVFDGVLQSFCVAFMSVLIPALVGKRQIRKGKVPPLAKPGIAPLSLPIRAGLVALSVAILGGLAGAACFLLNGSAEVPWSSALLGKTGYGAILGALVIRVTLPLSLAQ